MAKHALSGLRVVDLTIITAGACATQMLADLGAEIIKVESGRYPDPFRMWQGAAPAPTEECPDPWNRAPTFNMVNRNKLGICLDLKQEQGKEVLLQLVEVSDAVTENFRTGVMDRLGLSFEVLRERNPDIVMLSLGSQGSTGPESSYGSYGSTLDALSGLMSITGYDDDDGRPVWSSEAVNYPDQVASVFGAGLLLAGIRRRDRTGKGCHIDLSQRELVSSMIGEHVLEYEVEGRIPRPRGNRDPRYAPNDCFRCAGEDDWVAITVASEADWAALADVVGQPELAGDARFDTPLKRAEHEPELREIIESWTLNLSKTDAMQRLVARGVRAAAVNTGKDMMSDPHLASRRYYVPVENVSAGNQTLRVAPYTMSQTPPVIERPAPALGQDTAHVLRSVLGYTDDQILELGRTGVTANVPKSAVSA